MIRRNRRLSTEESPRVGVITAAIGLCLGTWITMVLSNTLLPSQASAATGRRTAPATSLSSPFRLSTPYDVPQQSCRQGFQSVWDIGFREWRCVMDGGINIGDSGGGGS